MNIMDNFISYTDDRGTLVPIELSEIPFEVKRLFFVNNVPENVIRGNHAHFKTKQILICLTGKIEIILDDGNQKISHTLNQYEKILIPELVWDYITFKKENTSILVLCSSIFDPNDYIGDYKEFVKIINK
jgi:dTDP-4-dehydrorhamnose 3,5-epimerase-like enzyme